MLARIVALAVATALVLATPADAPAKGDAWHSFVCGAFGCRDTGPRLRGRYDMFAAGEHLIGPPTATAPFLIFLISNIIISNSARLKSELKILFYFMDI